MVVAMSKKGFRQACLGMVLFRAVWGGCGWLDLSLSMDYLCLFLGLDSFIND